MPAQTTPKCGTRPIRYVALHFRDRSGEVSLCYRDACRNHRSYMLREALSGVELEQRPL